MGQGWAGEEDGLGSRLRPKGMGEVNRWPNRHEHQAAAQEEDDGLAIQDLGLKFVDLCTGF